MADLNDVNTVFLAEKEVERIENIVKARLEKCSEIGGQPREPRDSKDAIRQATGASLMADMGGADPDSTETNGRGGAIPALTIGQPYPPCTLPLKDLQPIKLADLQADTHHRGCQLTIKRVSPVVTLVSRSWTMVQEEGDDDTERLEVCLHKTRHGKDVLESARNFVIKEPYFTITSQGEPTIRIDHPSDLIILDGDLKGSQGSATQTYGPFEDLAEAAEEAEKIAKKCKDEGNVALEQQNLPLAFAKFTKGLCLARYEDVFKTNPDLARDLARNRAYVNLLLNQLDEAQVDAKAALIGKEDQRSKELDSKAYFRAGSAAYNLGQYQEAKACFEQQQELTPDNKTASAYLKNIEVRLREQETGAYNFKRINLGLSRSRPRVDAASFIGNTTVKSSGEKGRGLFATRDIPAGEIVMCEKAFCVVWGYESDALTAMTYDVRDDRIRVSPVGLSRAIVQKLLNNPSQIGRVMSLYGDYQGEGNNVTKTDDGTIVDTFRIHDIVSRNAFGPGIQFGEERLNNASTGLWIWAAYINHSCVSNVKKEYMGDLMILRATRPITAGEEIFHSYDESSDYDDRQSALMITWGFECECALCVVEKADDPAVRKKRRGLVDEVNDFVLREHWTNAKRLTISRARRLVKAIEDTYDEEKYKGLPRMATLRIKEWLDLATANQKR
ncbi:SET domain-containing protein [Hypoxylon fragiforme]|uniref:SET domain-containing protein n=1 Tax=Hypoxylon fragiforme TaxID=63214 RepID=UPI0020C5E97A|nr:SET domain-containing protein [Hypoxylon fragiforme]KAI2609504.1 SET domain-containing protein [Hypoxylon fragiforme]